jgi:SAM-dependent methyltransferase
MSTETFQIPIEAAEAYEAKFVPSMFAECAVQLLDAVSPQPGDRLLDVACGTGIVARSAAAMVEPGGAVVGVDLNQAMLTVAGRVGPDIDWRQGDAGALPFDDGEFDIVVSQMAFMFFPDRVAAFAEMGRVARADGTVAVMVPASIDAQPAYRPLLDIAAQHAGPDARALLDTYWNCGDLDALAATAGTAGLTITDRRTVTITARFESSDDFVATEVEGSPLIERIDDATYSRIKQQVAERLKQYETTRQIADQAGRAPFEIPLVCHILVARAA